MASSEQGHGRPGPRRRQSVPQSQQYCWPRNAPRTRGLGHCLTRSARLRSNCSTSLATSTRREPRCTPSCSTKAGTWPSVPTMYGPPWTNTEMRERRRQATHPAAKKPELIATGANHTWSLGHSQIARTAQVGAVLPLRGDRYLGPLSVTMRRYLAQLSVSRRPRRVHNAEAALLEFASFTCRQDRSVYGIGDLRRPHVEAYKLWLVDRTLVPY